MDSTADKNPIVLQRLLGADVADPVLSSRLLTLSLSILPNQGDVDDRSCCWFVLGIELNRRPLLGPYGDERCMNELGGDADRQNRLVFLGLSRAGKHFELPLAEANFSIDDHLFLFHIEPDRLVRNQSNEAFGSRQSTLWG